MINFICGQIVDTTDSTVIIENNNIGYEVFVSEFTKQQCIVGEKIQLFTYFQVKEDGMSLFGFLSKNEKNLFEKLITVGGIGCKTAIAILSNCSFEQIAFAIINADIRALSQIKGIGKKTAERIVLELREKVEAVAMAGEVMTEAQSNTIFALVSLGISQAQAAERVKSATENGKTTTEEILAFALKNF